MINKKIDVHSGKHTCPWWFIFTFDNPLRKLIQDPEKILKPYLKRSDTVLDVGCGMGYFSMGLAKLVGADGKVIAVDLQKEMLAGLKIRAERAGLSSRLELVQNTPDSINVHEAVDFALAFWMFHEVSKPQEFLTKIFSLLKREGAFLLAEPYIHVSKQNFERTVKLAQEVGFRVTERPKVGFSRAVLFHKR